MKDNIQVGFTRKPFGVKGQLKLKVEPDFLEDVLNADVLFIEIDGQQVPHFVDHFPETGELVVQFEDMDRREQVARLSSRPLYLRAADLIPAEKKQIPLENIAPHLKYLNYWIEEAELGKIGQIVRIEQFPQQDMAFVEHAGREVMIPLHPSFVVREDPKEQLLLLALPAGMLDL